MSTRFYDTDLTDAAWAFVAPVLPAARPGGRPRTTNLRSALNAIFYLLRTGCQWRLLPLDFHGEARSTITFGTWQSSGVWVHLHRVLLRAGPSSCWTGSLSIGGDHGWPIGQDDRAWWRTWFRRAQAPKGTQAPHLGRHTGPTGCQPSDRDVDAGGRQLAPPKPQARSNPEARPRMAATDRQETTT